MTLLLGEICLRKGSQWTLTPFACAKGFDLHHPLWLRKGWQVSMRQDRYDDLQLKEIVCCGWISKNKNNDLPQKKLYPLVETQRAKITIKMQSSKKADTLDAVTTKCVSAQRQKEDCKSQHVPPKDAQAFVSFVATHFTFERAGIHFQADSVKHVRATK